MFESLKVRGVDLTDSGIYYFEPRQIEWWDSENDTEMQLDVCVGDDDQIQVAIIFSPDVEGIVQRQYVFVANTYNNELKGDALIAKSVYEQLAETISLPFSDEHHAYIASDLVVVEQLFDKILQLVQ